MRTDIFLDKKCVHIKLDKDVHTALRSKLFRHNVSMQDLFEECATLVATDNFKGQSIVELIVKRKINEALTGKKKKRKEIVVSEVDTDTLYNMINESQDKDV
jgi:hypothetical protein